MPIGLVDDADFEKEFGSSQVKSSRVIEPQIVDMQSRGRKEGDTNVPDSLRQIIGEEAVLNGRQAALNLAKDFGISSSSVSAYSNGATSTTTYHSPSSSIIGHINKSKERATKRASKTLNAALSAISQEKLDYTDAKDLSVIAKNMSAIIKDLEPSAPQTEDNRHAPQFVIYAPQFRDERSFEVIQSNE